MKPLIYAAVLFSSSVAHAGLMYVNGGQFTSSIASNFAPTMVQTSELNVNHRGPQYSTYGYLGRVSASVHPYDNGKDYASLLMYHNLIGGSVTFAGDRLRTTALELAGSFEFTTTRDLELDWLNRSIPAPAFTLNGLPVQFERIPLTEDEYFFTLLPAGTHTVTFSGQVPYGSQDSISIMMLTIPEPDTGVLVLLGLLLMLGLLWAIR